MMKVSVIMVCYNAEKVLSRTLSSILLQDIAKEEMELLIIDGASSDNTGEVIARYLVLAKTKGYNVRFYSEPDGGIYDAMNKGAKLAEGEWCIYMNAGDRFFQKNSLRYLLNEADHKYGFLYSDTVFKQPIKSSKKYMLKYAPKESECTFAYCMPFCHQSSLVKTQLIKDNLFNTKYKIVGDYDFFIRIYKQGVDFHYVPHFISVFYNDGISATNPGTLIKENFDVALTYGFITKKEYDDRLLAYKRKSFIRKIIPKCILKTRRKLFHFDTPLYTWEEIRKKYC